MRSIILPFVVFTSLTAVGCGQKTNEAPKSTPSDSPLVAPQASATSQPFEAAFRADLIAWEPVKNVEITSKSASGSEIRSTEYRVKFKYDDSGVRSIDTTGHRAYSWPGRSANFGPRAAIKITKAYDVSEGALKAGDLWVWDGITWLSKKAADDQLAKSEAGVIQELGGLPVSTVLRDSNASVDDTLADTYAKFNDRPGDLQTKIKECLAEPKCIPAVAILKLPQDLGDIEKRLGRYQEKQDQTMLFPTDSGGREGKPVYWYRYGRLDVGVDFRSPTIVAVRIWAADY